MSERRGMPADAVASYTTHSMALGLRDTHDAAVGALYQGAG